MRKLFLLIIVLIVSIIIYLININIINYINKMEIKNNVFLDKTGLFLFSFTTSIFIICLFLKYGKSVLSLRHIILMVYLNIVGFIDYKTKNIYNFINILFALIGSIFIVIDIFNCDVQIFNIILVFFITIFLSKLKIIGNGDVDVFTIICMYSNSDLNKLIFNIFLSIALSGCVIFKNILRGNFKDILRKRVALCPFICISTFIILIL